MKPKDYAKHEKETMEERLSRLNKNLGRKEKHPGEHTIIRKAIAKIERRAAKNKKLSQKNKKAK